MNYLLGRSCSQLSRSRYFAIATDLSAYACFALKEDINTGNCSEREIEWLRTLSYLKSPLLLDRLLTRKDVKFQRAGFSGRSH